VTKFKYSAVTTDGATVSGVEDALTRSQALVALSRRNLDVTALQEKRSILSIEITKRKVPRKDLMHFSRQLAVFIRAGIPIIEGLEVISEDAGNKLFKKVLTEMAEALRGGMTFTDAAEMHPQAFPPFYLGILRSAELTGNLDTVLDQLSTYIERDVEARQKLMGSLIYPLVVTIMSLVSVAILVIFVLPKFTAFFDSLNAELPLPTRIMINGGKFFGDWWWVMGLTVLAAVLAVLAALRTERGKMMRDVILLRAPLVGSLTEYAVLERFCRILSSMVSAGVPLPEALAVTSEATNNRVYRRGLTQARESMLEGEGLAGPLSATGLFPAAARQMFRVGEDTGSLDQQMETAASYFDRELDYKLKRFTSLFEPLVIVVSGVMVGFIAIALVSAMYGIFQQVNF
jgi:type IV pilus assembly protein PilC